ncbi:MAG: ankyrin repeat domain-containing protein [Woeseiaceae bacterium]
MIYVIRIIFAGLVALAPLAGISQEKSAAIGCTEITVDDRGWTSLHQAARYNPNPDCLAKLIAAGADVNAKNKAGDTPLHWAAADNSNVEVVNLLIELGADVNAVDKFGWLPIHTAAERSSNPEVIAVLLQAGSKTDRRAYYVLFSPKFLLKRNDNMSKPDRAAALALLKESK